MAIERGEPFQLALMALHDRLREGRFRPGERIAATEIAEELQLSATPVREALSRLVGEGLIEDRRGQGYFVRSLSALDMADLYRLSLAQLSIALAVHRGMLGQGGGSNAAPVSLPDCADPVKKVERMFAAWICEAGGWALAVAHRTLQIQLGPVRRIEPLLFADLPAEAAELERLAFSEGAAERLRGLRRFHARRIALADRLYSLIQRHSRVGGV
jgi:hypothetical protein